MNCPSCGQENPADARFCAACGKPMPTIPTVVTTGNTQEFTRPPTPAAVSDGLKLGIAIGTVFMPLLGIVMGIIYMNDPNPEKRSVGTLWLYIGIGVLAVECIACGLMGM